MPPCAIKDEWKPECPMTNRLFDVAFSIRFRMSPLLSKGRAGVGVEQQYALLGSS
jgi:hypothetical protein